jgi:hypothetical protein
MIRRLTLIFIPFLLAWMYTWVVPVVIAHTLALPTPSWWDPLFPTLLSAVLTWTITLHTLAVLFASLPFAITIQILYGRAGVWIALALTITVYCWTSLPFVVNSFGPSPVRDKVVAILDAAKLVGILPLLVWLFGALPFDNRIDRTSTIKWQAHV